MSNLKVFLSIVSAIVLFLYGLSAFSQEIQRVGGDTLNKWLGRLTEKRWLALLLGAVATAIIQSSSAVTSLTVALVDAGTMSFRSSLGVLLGANIGTTSTAWLVSLKLTSIGPFFIVFGTLLSTLPTRYKILGKAAFYFGFIFFQSRCREFYIEAAGTECHVCGRADAISYPGYGGAGGDARHGDRSVEQHHNWIVHPAGATEPFASNRGDPDCDRCKHWDNSDSAGCQHQDATNGASRGGSQSLL
jgi:hypothetical protein